MLLLLRQEENRLRGGGVRPQSTALERSFDNLNDLRVVHQKGALFSPAIARNSFLKSEIRFFETHIQLLIKSFSFMQVG